MRNLPWLRDREYPALIDLTRERLKQTGALWVIENVAGARRSKLRPDGMQAAWLCGSMFGLPFYRHRYFETNFFWMQPGHPKHNGTIRPGRFLGSRARDVEIGGQRKVGANVGHAPGVALAREIMGIGWMARSELTQAIPPAYTEYIGRELMKVLGKEKVNAEQVSLPAVARSRPSPSGQGRDSGGALGGLRLCRPGASEHGPSGDPAGDRGCGDADLPSTR